MRKIEESVVLHITFCDGHQGACPSKNFLHCKTGKHTGSFPPESRAAAGPHSQTAHVIRQPHCGLHSLRSTILTPKQLQRMCKWTYLLLLCHATLLCIGKWHFMLTVTTSSIFFCFVCFCAQTLKMSKPLLTYDMYKVRAQIAIWPMGWDQSAVNSNPVPSALFSVWALILILQVPGVLKPRNAVTPWKCLLGGIWESNWQARSR